MKLSQSALLNLQLFPGQWPVLVIQFLYGGRCCKNQVCVSSPHSSQSHLAHWPLLWSNNHFQVMSQSPMHVPLVATLFPPEEANLTHTRIINLPFCYQLTWPATCAGKDRSLQHEYCLFPYPPYLPLFSRPEEALLFLCKTLNPWKNVFFWVSFATHSLHNWGASCLSWT